MVEQTLIKMLGLREAVVAISQQNQQLYDSTSQIGNISTLGSLVRYLASQTNIQAVNAAVEAVRVGEYGKGLAVVASEIGFLSRWKPRSGAKD
jgi:methyl-accepting chemotaxis protein